MSSAPAPAIDPATHASQPVLPRDFRGTSSGQQTTSKPAGYGMPCATCKTYYGADLDACPVCRSAERVAPTVAPVRAAQPAAATAGETPDLEVLEAERERFLKEFNAQLLAQTPARSVATNCIQTENHPTNNEPAVICQSCSDHLQERVDVLEAALHMELKEAAQIVYDAVWADPSDPAKTYENAAHALLSELRRRSGITLTFGLVQPPLTD